MTELFRVQSLSVLKKEFSALSKHATGKTQNLTNIKRDRGRETEPYFSQNKYKEMGPTSIDLSDVKSHRHKFDKSVRTYCCQKLMKARSGRMLDLNPETKDLEYNAVKSIDYIQSGSVPSIDMNKSPSRKNHFLSKFSGFNERKGVDSKKTSPTKFRGKRKLFNKKNLQKEDFSSERNRIGLLYHPSKARTEKTYNTVRPHSFDSYTKREPLQERSESSRLTYFNKNHIYPFNTNSYVPTLRKITGRQNKVSEYVETRSENVFADSFEKSKKWYNVDLSFLKQSHLKSEKFGKSTLEMQRKTGRENHINSHNLRSYYGRSQEYLRGIRFDFDNLETNSSTSSSGWKPCYSKSGGFYFKGSKKKRKKPEYRKFDSYKKCKDRYSSKTKHSKIPRLTVSGRDCEVSSIVGYVDSLVGYCDRNESLYESIRRNVEKKLEKNGYGVRIRPVNESRKSANTTKLHKRKFKYGNKKKKMFRKKRSDDITSNSRKLRKIRK